MLDLNKFCQQLIDEFQNTSPEGHVFRYVKPDKPVMALIDEKLLDQALTNLMNNALKYSPKGDPNVVTLSNRENEAIIRVTDSNIGIPKADQKHLFETFHRASNVGHIQGNTLGALNCKTRGGIAWRIRDLYQSGECRDDIYRDPAPA